MFGQTTKEYVKVCEGYKYVGRQYFGEYWWGNDDKYDKHDKDNGCLCNGENVDGWINCVYRYLTFDLTSIPSLKTTTFPLSILSVDPSVLPSVKYLSCFKDIKDRTLPISKNTNVWSNY